MYDRKYALFDAANELRVRIGLNSIQFSLSQKRIIVSPSIRIKTQIGYFKTQIARRIH